MMIHEINEVCGVPVPPGVRADCYCSCEQCQMDRLMAAYQNIKFFPPYTLANVLLRLQQVENGDS